MKLLALTFLCVAPLMAQAKISEPPLPVSSASLVRVNSTNQAFDFFRPWIKKAPFMRRGLGVVLENHQILVTAELVANRTYVELEKADSAEKTQAEVLVVDYDANLALLKPTDETFLSDAKPLKLDDGAKVGDRGYILQLESNGLIAQTPATITTIAVNGYPMGRLSLLTYKVSAPLQNREGSFTIPAVRDGRLLGLLMRYDARSQTAEIIPAPVIRHFLEDAKLEKYPGFPRAGIAFAGTRDPQFRRYIGLKENGGVYVTEVKPESAADNAGIRRGDVIVSVGGKSVDQDGNYDHPDYGKISFSHLASTEAHTGDTVEFVLLRDGKMLTVPVVLTSVLDGPSVSDPYRFDRQPRYLILGGLVFQELSRPYLQEWGNNWPNEAPQRLVYLDAYQSEREAEGGKVVFLSQVLPSGNSLGYDNLDHRVIQRVNGTPIKSLDDLAKAVATPKDGIYKIEFEEDPGFIILDAKSIESEKEQLMMDYHIPSLQNLN